MAETRHVPAAKVRAQIDAVLRSWGMPDDKIAVTSDAMVETDLRGVDSHGISMLIMYDQIYRAGQLKLDAEPRIVRETAATALVDAGAGLGHPVSAMAMDLAVRKAKAVGVAAVSVFNSHHFGAAGIYSHMAAKQNLIGMVFSSSKSIAVVPTRGMKSVFGTNVVSFAAPSRAYLPVILDMSTSVVAVNKVKIYALAQKDLPVGWVVDGSGEPVTDSALAYQRLTEGGEGGLNPLGGSGSALSGHKGYGLGLFIQILASTLSGGSFSPIRNKMQKAGDPDNIGHLFIALDPVMFRPLEAFQQDLDDVLATLKNTPPINPDEPVLVPGDPEWTARDRRLAEGIPMSEGLINQIRQIAVRAGAPYHLGA